MSFLTKNKDVDLLILEKLSDKDLIRICLVNAYARKLSYNEDFWRRRFITRFGAEFMKWKNKDRTWREFYLAIIRNIYRYSLTGTVENIEGGLEESAFKGQKDLVDFFIAKGAKNFENGVEAAIRGKNKDIVYYLISKGVNRGWNGFLDRAAETGDRELVDFFISKGANDWDDALVMASEGGHKELVDFFISKGAKKWNAALSAAAEGGHKELVDFFISKGAKKWNDALRKATKARNKELISFFLAKGATNLNEGVVDAIRGGDVQLVEFFLDKGGKIIDWNDALDWALRFNRVDMAMYIINKGESKRVKFDFDDALSTVAFNGNLELVKFFVMKGAKDYNDAIKAAKRKGHNHIIYYLESLQSV